MTINRKRNPDISHEAWELILYAQNSRELVARRDAIIKNVIRKINRGVYDPTKAPRLWQYWIDDAAQRYTKEFDTPRPGGRSSYGVFTRPIRLEAATYIAPIYYGEIKDGEFDHLLKLKGNPMAKRKRKRKATPAQLRALAKGRRTLAARRKTKKKTRRRNPAYGNYSVARGVVRQGWPKKKRTPTRSANPCRASKQYGIQVGSRYFDGAGMTSKKEDAARWRKLNPCKRVAQKLADATGKDVAIVGM